MKKISFFLGSFFSRKLICIFCRFLPWQRLGVGWTHPERRVVVHQLVQLRHQWPGPLHQPRLSPKAQHPCHSHQISQSRIHSHELLGEMGTGKVGLSTERQVTCMTPDCLTGELAKGIGDGQANEHGQPTHTSQGEHRFGPPSLAPPDGAQPPSLMLLLSVYYQSPYKGSK